MNIMITSKAITRKNIHILYVVVAIILLLGGCGGMVQNRRTISLIEYLYPQNIDVDIKASSPAVTKPLKISIAFVPEVQASSQAMSNMGVTSSLAERNFITLNDQQRRDVMNKMAAEFKKFSFIKSCDVIPSTYFIPKGSFQNLDQIRSMYDIDAIGLISYD